MKVSRIPHTMEEFHMQNLEILSPAGDPERLRAALDFGADAVYLGGNLFGMRQGAPNFNAEALCDGVKLAHSMGKKVYLTVNTLPRNDEFRLLPQFISEAVNAGVDAMIVADLGVLSVIRRLAPQMCIHMSTQTGIVNYETANVLYEMGARRVVLARELSLEEIAEIRRKTPKSATITASTPALTASDKKCGSSAISGFLGKVLTVR